jgi:hypothetical protein
MLQVAKLNMLTAAGACLLSSSLLCSCDTSNGNPNPAPVPGPTGDSVELPATLTDDTLYAVPNFTGAIAGETDAEDALRITVATGELPNDFQFMNGIGIILLDGAHYVPESFNVGAIGGAADAADGLWAEMNPASGFLMPPDNFIREIPASGDYHRIDFNVTPLGGSDLTSASGELFNFGVWFDSAGSYRIGIAEVQGVARTYYSSSLQTNYYWGNVDNDESGVRNFVEVE